MSETQLDLAALFPDLNLDEIDEQRIALYLVAEQALKPSAELRNSLARRGQLQPVLLNARTGSDGKFGIVDGRRRIAAARELGWTAIRAYVIEVDPLVEATLAVTANAVRSANPVSDVQAILDLNEAGYTEREIVQATGLHINVVRKRLKLARLSKPLFSGMVAGKVAITVAERIASMPADVQRSLESVLLETGRVTGDDVHEANSVGVATAVAEMDDIFAGLDEPPAPKPADPFEMVVAELRPILRTYWPSVRTVDDWKRAIDRAYHEEIEIGRD